MLLFLVLPLNLVISVVVTQLLSLMRFLLKITLIIFMMVSCQEDEKKDEENLVRDSGSIFNFKDVKLFPLTFCSYLILAIICNLRSF